MMVGFGSILRLAPYAWLGYLFWSILTEFVSQVYFTNLVSMSLGPSLVFLGFLFSPALLGVGGVREFVAKNRGLVYGSAIIGVLGYMTGFRLLLLGIGLAGSLLGFCCSWWYWRHCLRGVSRKLYLLQ